MLRGSATGSTTRLPTGATNFGFFSRLFQVLGFFSFIYLFFPLLLLAISTIKARVGSFGEAGESTESSGLAFACFFSLASSLIYKKEENVRRLKGVLSTRQAHGKLRT